SVSSVRRTVPTLKWSGNRGAGQSPSPKFLGENAMSTEQHEIHVDVTPSLDLIYIQRLPGSEDDATLREAYQAFHAAYTGIASVYEARRSLAEDPTLNDSAKLLKAADFAEKK